MAHFVTNTTIDLPVERRCGGFRMKRENAPSWTEHLDEQSNCLSDSAPMREPIESW